jgi:hypothetical protein
MNGTNYDGLDDGTLMQWLTLWTSSLILFLFIWNNISMAGLCLRPQVKKLALYNFIDIASPYLQNINDLWRKELALVQFPKPSK